MLFDEGLADNRYLFRARGDGGSRDTFGYIAGSLTEPFPQLAYHQQYDPNKRSSPSWQVSSHWVVNTISGLSATSWDRQTTFVLSDIDPDRMPINANNIAAIGPDVFWDVGDLYYGGTMSWNPESGTRPLLRWPGDFTRGTGNFATDGVDMVWTYGEDKAPSEEIWLYKRLSIMTAPYTTDPAKAKATARRLRSDLRTLGVYPFAIGCGYAAHPVPYEGYSGGLLIVRLADGVSWLIPGSTDPGDYQFATSLGFICDTSNRNVEVVNTLANVEAWTRSGVFTVVRIPIDALGPGQPPD